MFIFTILENKQIRGIIRGPSISCFIEFIFQIVEYTV